MGLINSNKQVDKTQIQGKESFKVKLSLTAAADIINDPKDIVLVLDKSGSMNGVPLNELKKGAKQFVDILDKYTDNLDNGEIGYGSKISIVSFSTDASIDLPLTTSVQALNNAIDSITSSGTTNHQDAFIKAMEALDDASTNGKIIIIFTDGFSNSGKEGFVEAQQAKAKGITIYSIGLTGGSSKIDEETLKKWASTPSGAYVLLTPDTQAIEDTFKNLATSISKPAATNACLVDKISPCFEIVSVEQPTKGNGVIVNNNEVKWTIPTLGVSSVAETASFEFTVQHTGNCVGNIPVNESYNYKDDEGNVIALPDPTILITTDPDVVEDCPVAYDVTIQGCEDFIEYDAGEIALETLGRVLQVSATIKNVCPNKRVALAVILTEVDDFNEEHSRGMKTMLIPAHSDTACRDVKVRCIKFVLPEELDTVGSPNSLCGARKFKVRFIANYVENNYKCCKDTI